jgi:hypothetical protein
MTDPYAYLFDADALEQIASGRYHHPAIRAFFTAVLDADTDGGLRFALMHGDLLLHFMVLQASSVKGSRTKHGSQIGTAQAFDRDLMVTLMWDLCESIEKQPHTVAVDQLPDLLGRHNIYVLAPSHITESIAAEVDERLRGVPGYAGSFVPDPGNPVHQRLTAGSLIAEPWYVERGLLFDPLHSEDPFDPPPLLGYGDDWYADLSFSSVKYLDDNVDRGTLPRWPHGRLSERGERSLEILRKRTSKTHMHLLAVAVHDLRLSDDDFEFEFDVTVMPRASDAIVEEQKLTRYVLNPDHPDGSAKAYLFRTVLGINADDWRYLSAQLKDGLAAADSILKTRSTQFGVQYHVVTSVLGRNGETRPVLSAWEVRADQPPRLVTAYLSDRGDSGEHLPAPSPTFVVDGPDGDDRWLRIWEIAIERAEQAARETIPTPIRVDGHWYPEGAFGFAQVTVRDARRGFARWLVTTGKASTRRGRGAVFSAPGFMHERGRAYVEAFVDVLRRNGVPCEWSSRLD